MHKISNRIFEIFFKKTLDFLLAGFRFFSFLFLEKHRPNTFLLLLVLYGVYWLKNKLVEYMTP